jgi:lipopolysaccharide export system protein LptA
MGGNQTMLITIYQPSVGNDPYSCRLRYSIIRPLLFGILPAVAFLLIVACANSVDAQLLEEKGLNANLPVEITADELISHGTKNYAEFIGSVAAVQGDFSIHSDTLRIYYQNSAADGSKDASKPDAIEKIVAIGNVVIQAEARRAETDRAEYRLKEDVVVLSGENSIVTDGKNTLTGSKITWRRDTGQITVEGSEQKRVKAVFYSTESLSLPPQGGPKTPDSPAKIQ